MSQNNINNVTSKILSLLSKANNSKFLTRKSNIVKDNSKANYCEGNEIIRNTEVLESNLRDYNDACFLVTSYITARAALETQVGSINCAPFTKCTTQIEKTTIDDSENLLLVMPMYNLIEYSSNYSETTGYLWFYSKDEGINFYADITNTDEIKSFDYKAK